MAGTQTNTDKEDVRRDLRQEEKDMKKEVPNYKELLWPVLKALKALGRSASIQEILEQVASDLELSDEVLNIPHNDSGDSEFYYQCAWSRTYLKKVGAVDNSSRGVWVITEAGRGIQTQEEIREKVRLWENLEGRRGKKPKAGDGDDDVSSDLEWEERLRVILSELKADSFERLCQRILREAGFEKVEVTGRSGDGGIDGVGVLQINLLSFHVAFQCKKYNGSVGPDHVRDLRGAINGRAEKGLLITTGFFTRGAEQEAVRPGAKTIDLIDGHDLCRLLKDLGLGVDTESVEVVKLRPEFFENY